MCSTVRKNTEIINKKKRAYQYAENIEDVMNALEINVEEVLNSSVVKIGNKQFFRKLEA